MGIKVHSYHQVRDIIHGPQFHKTHEMVCVACNGRDQHGNEYRLMPAYKPRRSPPTSEHVAQVLPCGHFMGASCIAAATDPHCPRCKILFARQPTKHGHCAHAIKLPLVLFSKTLKEEEECSLLAPTARLSRPKCEDCVTKEELLKLTMETREALSKYRGLNEKRIYCTNGKIHGIFADDQIDASPDSDATVSPVFLSEELYQSAHMMEHSIQRRFHMHRHAVDTEVVFKMGTYTGPPTGREVFDEAMTTAACALMAMKGDTTTGRVTGRPT
ncbi:hypothetical protein PT974_06413 [Cladobotryum mycophilum]|uniref:RING-type domain-containing protein n=1 Tax=Cladobotryum mycophilum TaxID=491253 RepID=A0ABR0SLI7_9HYPO